MSSRKAVISSVKDLDIDHAHCMMLGAGKVITIGHLEQLVLNEEMKTAAYWLSW